MNDEFQTEDDFPTPELMVITPNPQSSVQIIDKDENTADASEITMPSSRHFRDAWSLSADVITEDIEAARAIFKDKIREVRKPLLEAEDAVSMKALETDDETAKAASAVKKNNLRDAPAASAISSATTIDELKAAWDSDLLGDNPYA